MMDVIRLYVQGAFAGVPETPESLEQQEEIIADLAARVADLVERGQTEQEALGIAFASVGDLGVLVSEFEPDEAGTAAPPAVEVFVTRLGVHTAVISSATTTLVMLAVSVGAIAMGAFHLGHTLLVVAFLFGYTAWVATELVLFHRDAHLVATVRLVERRDMAIALGGWALIAMAAFVMNMFAFGIGFWCWIVWIGVAVAPAAVAVRGWLLGSGRFQPEVVAEDA
jgi:hypothetical protein